MTYWHYTFIKSAKFNGELNFGGGVRSSDTEFPDFTGIHESYPDIVILSVNEIDKEEAAGISRSQQYKMAGNSIVVSCLYHIFRKMFINTGFEGMHKTLF